MIEAQERETRIKQSKRYILEKTTSSLLNNKKWFNILDKIQDTRQSLEIKLLLSDQTLKCDFIREVEETSALFDDSGNFIEYLEIEYITINATGNFPSFLIKLNVVFLENLGKIIIKGYSK